jgi:hypothetical protein
LSFSGKVKVKVKKNAWTNISRKNQFNQEIAFYFPVVERKPKVSDEENRADECLQQPQFVLNCWFMTGGYFGATVLGAIAYFVGIGIREEVDSFDQYLIEVAKVYILEEYCVWWTGFYVLIIGNLTSKKCKAIYNQ